MKSLTIPEQVNACLKHAKRNNIIIEHMEFYPDKGDNHSVIACYGESTYYSVAVLINMKNNTFYGSANDSTWN